MTYITRATAAAGALLASVGLLAAGPAHAAPRDSLQGNWLVLSVTRGVGRSGNTRGPLVVCDAPLGL
ncbi:serine protease, partial [Streptomyces diastatochromogenes]